jgi:parvulin-like peptidyl-prolyl isomerase
VPFEEVALRESADSTSRMDGGDLGVQHNDRFVPEFTEAARALRPGQVSDPVQTPYGYHIIQLERRTTDSLHARHILIPVELTGDHLDMVDARADTLDLYGAEQTEPGALEDVAEMLGLEIAQAPPVTEGNRVFAEGQVVPDAGMWAFDALSGETSPVIESDRAFFLFRLDSLRAEGIPAFESIQAAVRRAAIDAKKWEGARHLADSIAQNLRAGQPLMDAALSNLLNARSVGPMTRANPDPSLRSAPKVIGAAFGLGVGEASGPIESESAIYLVEPASKLLADSSAFVEQLEEQRNRYIQAAQQQRIQRFMVSLRSAADIVDRRREIDRIQRELADMETTNPFSPLGF